MADVLIIFSSVTPGLIMARLRRAPAGRRMGVIFSREPQNQRGTGRIELVSVIIGPYLGSFVR